MTVFLPHVDSSGVLSEVKGLMHCDSAARKVGRDGNLPFDRARSTGRWDGRANDLQMTLDRISVDVFRDFHTTGVIFMRKLQYAFRTSSSRMLHQVKKTKQYRNSCSN